MTLMPECDDPTCAIREPHVVHIFPNLIPKEYTEAWEQASGCDVEEDVEECPQCAPHPSHVPGECSVMLVYDRLGGAPGNYQCCCGVNLTMEGFNDGYTFQAFRRVNEPQPERKSPMFDRTDAEVSAALIMFTLIFTLAGASVGAALNGNFFKSLFAVGGVTTCVTSVIFFMWHLIRKGANALWEKE